MIDAVKAVRSIEIPDVKIYEAKGDKLSNLTKGTLEILYIPECDRFILKANSFQYVLSRNIPVMASLLEQRAFRSYILPSVQGYYLLKLKSNPPPAVIQNFETVLAAYSQFSYKSDDRKILTDQVTLGGKENQPINKKEAMKAGDYIQKGGEVIKQNLLKAAYYVGKNLTTPDRENIILVKTIDQLKVPNPGQQYVEYPGTGVTKLIGISNDIQTSQQLRNQGVLQPGRPLPQNTGTWDNVKTATASSAKSLWAGMGEAGGILAKAYENRKKKQTPKKITEMKQQKAMDKMNKDFEHINLVDSVQNFNPVASTQPQIVQVEVKETVTKYPVKTLGEDKDHYFAPSNDEYHPGGYTAEGNIYPHIDPAPGYTNSYFNKQTAIPGNYDLGSIRGAKH